MRVTGLFQPISLPEAILSPVCELGQMRHIRGRSRRRRIELLRVLRIEGMETMMFWCGGDVA